MWMLIRFLGITVLTLVFFPTHEVFTWKVLVWVLGLALIAVSGAMEERNR